MPSFIPQSDQVGSVPAVPDALASAQLDTAILTDPAKIRAYKDSIAGQMNSQSGGPTFADLSERIADVTIETSAQGASFMKVAVIDPLWVLSEAKDSNGQTFIQVDADGFLWPPIEINFPTGTDCVWRLVQYHADWSADLTAANVTLTFEDRIASLLREMSPIDGISQGQPNQTLGGFIKQLVDNTNRVLKPKPQIRLVELISPADPNYTPPVNQLPLSAQTTLSKQATRTNPNKTTKGLSASQLSALGTLANVLLEAGGSISATETLGAAKARQLQAQGSRVWTGPASAAGPTRPGNGRF